MISKTKTVEFIVPLFNEEQCIEEFLSRVIKLHDEVDAFDISCLLINDGSADRSLEIIQTYSAQYSYIKYINLSRNFGHQIAVTAGLDHCHSDYAVIIDSDLQDPPELVVELFNRAQRDNCDIVYAVRRSREKETFFKLFTASLFYKLINKLCDMEIPSSTGDFRLVSRKAIESIRTMRERHRFLRGMFPWIGFKSGSILYDRKGRFAGTTKYPFRKMFKFALDAILSFSNAPLRAVTLLGFSAVLLGIIGIVAVLYLRIFTSYTVPGISAVLMTVVFLGGVQILMLGIVGEYIGKIFEEIKGRPLYFVEGSANLESRAVQLQPIAQNVSNLRM